MDNTISVERIPICFIPNGDKQHPMCKGKRNYKDEVFTTCQSCTLQEYSYLNKFSGPKIIELYNQGIEPQELITKYGFNKTAVYKALSQLCGDA